MEPAAQRLEVLFSKAESELATLSCMINQEFSILAAAQGVDTQVINELVHNVKNIRAQLNQILSEVLEFQQQQQTVMSSMQSQLSTLCVQFNDLSMIIGPAALEAGSDKEYSTE
ncbi:hypothetical protein OTU49_009779 [Cherax quadricarinatus]|uniref:Ska2 N-terminal domain-containing protein n=1 Tax=Cherax quadricarinatus TaxID=27406 RepID=A0AAW0W9G9_CHEQU